MPVEKVFPINKTNSDQRCVKRMEYGMAGRKN